MPPAARPEPKRNTIETTPAAKDMPKVTHQPQHATHEATTH